LCKCGHCFRPKAHQFSSEVGEQSAQIVASTPAASGA
jgi:hypothetical protein